MYLCILLIHLGLDHYKIIATTVKSSATPLGDIDFSRLNISRCKIIFFICLIFMILHAFLNDWNALRTQLHDGISFSDQEPAGQVKNVFFWPIGSWSNALTKNQLVRKRYTAAAWCSIHKNDHEPVIALTMWLNYAHKCPIEFAMQLAASHLEPKYFKVKWTKYIYLVYWYLQVSITLFAI